MVYFECKVTIYFSEFVVPWRSEKDQSGLEPADPTATLGVGVRRTLQAAKMSSYFSIKLH